MSLSRNTRNTRTGKTPTDHNRCLYYYCKLYTDSIHCSDVSIIDFEQINACWVCNTT